MNLASAFAIRRLGRRLWLLPCLALAGHLPATDDSRSDAPLPGPPVIVAQPQSQTVATGGDVRFSVTASGVPEPTYQWFKNGNLFIGATAGTLDIINARSSDADDYKVTITNEFGSVTSAKATLTVTPAPIPAAGPPPALPGGGGSPSIWFLLTLGALAALRRRHGN